MPTGRIQIADKISGVIYGQAIGDALGLGTEFMTKAEVQKLYPYRLTRYGQILRDSHRRRWEPGAWTDDTDQMLCILDSLLEHQAIHLLDIARRFHTWALTGMGIGQTVYSVLHHPDYLTDPHLAAQEVWERTGRDNAPNGGVMRTSILGVWDYQHPDAVQLNAENVCKITHVDPRCVGSCVLVSRAISGLLRGESVSDLVQQAYLLAPVYDTRIIPYLDKAISRSLSDLQLDEGLDLETGHLGKIGYTLKAMGAGFWTLTHAEDFLEGILSIIHEGGDADSNAAVAGAMLGAKFGFSQMPQKYAEALADYAGLKQRVEKLLGLMELDV